MATKKITELTAATSVAATDIVPVVNDPSGTPATKKATIGQLVAAGGLVAPGASGNILTSDGSAWQSQAPVAPDTADDVRKVGGIIKRVFGWLGIGFKKRDGTEAADGSAPRIGGTGVYTEENGVPGYRLTHPVMHGHVDPRHFYAVPDWNIGRTVTTSIGFAVVTMNSTADLVDGQPMYIEGLGTVTIDSIADATHAVLSAPASGTVVDAAICTDNVDAFNAALAYLRARETYSGPIDNYMGKLVIDGHYFLSNTLHLEQGVIVEGVGRANDVRAFTSRSGAGAMIVNPHDVDSIVTHAGTGGRNSAELTQIRNIVLYCKDYASRPGGGAETNGAFPPDGHTGTGILIQATTIVDNVLITGYATDGIRGEGGSGFPGGIEGSKVSNSFAIYCGQHGFCFYGNDGHVNIIEACNATKCWGYGFYDDSGVGNKWDTCLGQENSGVIAEAGGWLADGKNHDYGTGPTFANINKALFLNCYTEGAPVPSNEIMFPACAIGGMLGDPNAFGPTADGFALDTTGITGTRPIVWQRAGAATAIATYLGNRNDALVGLKFQPIGVPGMSDLDVRLNTDTVPYGWWSIDHTDGSTAGGAHVMRFPSDVAKGRSYMKAPWFPHGILLGEGSGLTSGQTKKIAASTPPTINDRNSGVTYEVGDTVENTGTPGQSLGWVCTVAGTQDTLAGVTTVSDDGGFHIDVSTTTGIYAGCYLTFAGVTGVYKVASISGTTLTLGTALASSPGAGAAVAYSPATLIKVEEVVRPTEAVAALDVDWSLSGTFRKTLGAGANAITFSNVRDGQTITMKFTSDAGGSTATFPTVVDGVPVRWPGGTLPTQSTPSKTDAYTFVHMGDEILGIQQANFA